MTEVNVGNLLKHRELLTIHGEPVQVPEPERLVHLQFRRYAGCPICNMHLRSVSQRHEEILAAAIREVVVFHSSAETMLEFQGELPFAVIADPAKKLYAEFGVESSLKAVLNPRAPLAGFRARSVVHSVRRAIGIGEKGSSISVQWAPLSTARQPGSLRWGLESCLVAVSGCIEPQASSRRTIWGGEVRQGCCTEMEDPFGEKHLGLPADVLIAPDGLVLAAKYGKYASDQWSVDELLDLAKPHSRQLAAPARTPTPAPTPA